MPVDLTLPVGAAYLTRSAVERWIIELEGDSHKDDASARHTLKRLRARLRVLNAEQKQIAKL